jgi:hypothetical protein
MVDGKGDGMVAQPDGDGHGSLMVDGGHNAWSIFGKSDGEWWMVDGGWWAIAMDGGWWMVMVDGELNENETDIRPISYIRFSAKGKKPNEINRLRAA